jgi:hypothetical protein
MLTVVSYVLRLETEHVRKCPRTVDLICECSMNHLARRLVVVIPRIQSSGLFSSYDFRVLGVDRNCISSILQLPVVFPLLD